MVNGFFLGGAAEGIKAGRELGLRQRALDEEAMLNKQRIGLEARRLGLGENELKLKQQALADEKSRATITQVDAAIANTMKIIGSTIEAGVSAGRSPDQIRKTIQPLLMDVQGLSQRIGRDSTPIINQVDALLAAPTPVETATSQGRVAAAKTVGQMRGLTEAGVPEDAAMETAGIKLPEGFKPTNEERNRLSKMTVAHKVLDQELKNFSDLIKENGVSFLSGTEERVKYDAARRNIQMQMKELYNLGVLNGPDLMLMDQMLIDPAVRIGGKTSSEGVQINQSLLDAASWPIRASWKRWHLQGNADANIKQLRAQLDRLYNANVEAITHQSAPSGASDAPDPLGIR